MLPASPLLGSHQTPEYTSPVDTHNVTSNYHTPFLKQDHGNSFGVDTSLIVAQVQKFAIHQITPEWGYATESTKVLVTFCIPVLWGMIIQCLWQLRNLLCLMTALIV